MSGVDTAVYFVFLTSVLAILILLGLMLLPLLPVAGTDVRKKLLSESNSNGTFTDRNKLAMGNRTEKSPRLWAFLVGTYWVSFVTFYILWKAYNHCCHLRASALIEPKLKPEQFTVLVRDIPPVLQGQNRQQEVNSCFKALHPERTLERLLKIWEKLEGYHKKLGRAEAVFAASKTEKNLEGTKPAVRTGFLGHIGPKVDTMTYYNDKINEISKKLDVEQKIIIKEKHLLLFSSTPNQLQLLPLRQSICRWLIHGQ